MPFHSINAYLTQKNIEIQPLILQILKITVQTFRKSLRPTRFLTISVKIIINKHNKQNKKRHKLCENLYIHSSYLLS